jgi:REP element-mobilizing transposase RayT
MARSRYKIIENSTPHFCTATIVEWLPLFSKPWMVKIILDSIQFLQKEKRWTIYAWVIMENHLHLIASSDNLSKELGNFKSYTARQIIDHCKRNHPLILKQLAHAKQTFKQDRDYQFWQEGSHPEQIQNSKMMRQKIEYIHYNPVRRGYVEEPEDWRYSSAGNYSKKPGLIEVCTDWI